MHDSQDPAGRSARVPKVIAALATVAPACRVLIVDDDNATRVLVHTSLRHIGYCDVVQCTNGQEALTEFKQRPAHLVISDLNMPKLDGLGLLRAIRGTKAGAKTPFILLTSRGEVKIVKQALASKADGFLVKPFTIAGLKAKVDAAVAAGRPGSELWFIHD